MKFVLFSIASAIATMMTEGVFLDSYDSSPTFLNEGHATLPSYLMQNERGDIQTRIARPETFTQTGINADGVKSEITHIDVETKSK